MHDSAESIADRVARIRERIAAAAVRSGRSSRDIKLVAVTKYVGPDAARELVACGCQDLGESRPQQLWHKAESLSDLPVRWHMIGHLQRNKVRRTLPLISLLQSGDTLRLLETVNQLAGEAERRLPVLLEVNVSGDETKHGFPPDELESQLPPISRFKHLQVRGLMCMAGRSTGDAGACRDFENLRKLRERLRKNCPREISFAELSMGMSADFEIAIEQGATMIRIGSALYPSQTR